MEPDNILITDRQKIRELFEKTKEDIDQDIDIILQWFETQKHLPEKLSRNAIEKILVTSKFSIETTKKLCDMYFTARTLVPEVFQHANPKEPEQMIYMNEILYYFPLPRFTKEFFRVKVFSLRDFEYHDYNPLRIISQLQMFFEVLTQEDLTMGDVVLIDLKHIKKDLVVKATPTYLKMLNFFVEQHWAHRVKGLHYINVPPFAEIAISLTKTIVKKKIMKRMHVHSSYEAILEYIPKEILPKDYGGEERSLDELNELWKLKLQKYQPFFEHLQKLKVNESLRPEPLVNSDILGYYGNFKQLDVD